MARITHFRPMGALLAFLTICTTSSRPTETPPSSFSFVIEEEAGIARTGEPVTVSLPFAQGTLYDPQVQLSDSTGKILSAQHVVLARWGDSSIRWLLTRALVNLSPKGRLVIRVQKGETPSAGLLPLAKRDGDRLTVNTGVIQASFGPSTHDSYILTDTRGPVFARPPTLVVYSEAGNIHRCERPDKVELEENGPLYASVFLAGPMKPQQGEPVFRYETRLHFWRGKPLVKAEHTLVKVAGDSTTEVDGIVVEMKMAEPPGRVHFAGDEGHPVRLGDRFLLRQNCAYWQETLSGTPPDYVVLERDFSFGLTNKEKTLQSGDRSDGWVRVTTERRMFGLAVQNFWEEGPKALWVTGDGQIGAELYAHWKPQSSESRPGPYPGFEMTKRVGAWEQNLDEFTKWVRKGATPYYYRHPDAAKWISLGDQKRHREAVELFIKLTGYNGPRRRGPVRFGLARAKTTEVLYVFDTVREKESLIRTLAAARSYLVPVVDPSYLCSTRVLPWVWKPAAQSHLPNFEKGLMAAFRRYQDHAQTYGFLHFGDGQCNFGYNGNFPSSADVLEYDTIRCLLMQFARTGITDYLRRANQSARHYADVDQNHLDGTVHFHGYYWTADFHEEPKASDMGGHIYAQGVVDHYALTGDRRSLRSFQRIGRALLEKYRSSSPESEVRKDERSLARPAIALLAIYDLSRNPTYLEPVKRVLEIWNALVLKTSPHQDPFRIWYRFPGDNFPAHPMELLAYYHALTGDEKTLQSLVNGAEYLLQVHWDSELRGWRQFPHYGAERFVRFPRARSSPNEKLGFGFAYATFVTGNLKYLRPFLDQIEQMGVGWEKQSSNRQFTKMQLWSIPFVSLLPDSWPEKQDLVVLQEVFRAELTEQSRFQAWTPDGKLEPALHGDVHWTSSPWGSVSSTVGRAWISYEIPHDILKFPGTLTFWAKLELGIPLPSVYGLNSVRSLVFLSGGNELENSLDIMLADMKVRTRLYDSRGWEIAGLGATSPWDEMQISPPDSGWHHVAIVWNRFSLKVYIDAQLAAETDASILPGGRQTKLHLGWRPDNFYGQASFYYVRLFKSALPQDWISKLRLSELAQRP